MVVVESELLAGAEKGMVGISGRDFLPSQLQTRRPANNHSTSYSSAHHRSDGGNACKESFDRLQVSTSQRSRMIGSTFTPNIPHSIINPPPSDHKINGTTPQSWRD